LAGTITADARGPACACRHALAHALITADSARDPLMVERLKSITSHDPDQEP
jgi:5'-methylthioadenosine phosphorylase